MPQSRTVSLRVDADLHGYIAAILDHVEMFRKNARRGDPDFGEAERRLYDLVAEAERAAVGRMLSALDPATERVRVNGCTWRRMNLEAGDDYFALRGPVRVQRGLYRQEGVRNGPTIVPMDLRAGIVEQRYTPAAAKAAAALAQAVPSREADGICKATGVLPYSRSSQLRMGDDIGGRWESLREDAELGLLRKMEIPDTAAAVSVAADRVSLPMAELRPITVDDAADGVRRPYQVNYRMAFVGVVTLYDREGHPLTCVRHAHVADEGADAVQTALAADVNSVLVRRPDLKLVVLSDGAPEMQSIVDAAVTGHEVTAALTDLWHLLEKLGDAIRDTGRFVPDQLGDWAADLLARDDTIDAIEEVLRTWERDYDPEAVPDGLQEALTYIENRRDRLRYATAHAAGLPVGSGTVEATGKTIVQVRMKRAGASWTVDGAQAILGLRALWTSSQERWHAAFEQILGSYRAQVTQLRAPRRVPVLSA